MSDLFRTFFCVLKKEQSRENDPRCLTKERNGIMQLQSEGGNEGVY